jgi:hypothetical protein
MWLDDKYWFSYLLEGKSFIGRWWKQRLIWKQQN